GQISTCASGAARRTPAAIAAVTSAALRQSLNLSGAMTMRMFTNSNLNDIDLRLHLRSVDQTRPVAEDLAHAGPTFGITGGALRAAGDERRDFPGEALDHIAARVGDGNTQDRFDDLTVRRDDARRDGACAETFDQRLLRRGARVVQPPKDQLAGAPRFG